MKSREFSGIRHSLDKTQKELASLLCVSLKAIQSYEADWRNIPVAIERQMLFLLSLKVVKENKKNPCWDDKKCPDEWKKNCAAWELQAGYFCWFMNGTFCNGEYQDSWNEKLELCRQCHVFQSVMPFI